MPINVTGIVLIIATVLALIAFATGRGRSLKAIFAILLAAGLVIAITDQGTLDAMGRLVRNGITYVSTHWINL